MCSEIQHMKGQDEALHHFLIQQRIHSHKIYKDIMQLCCMQSSRVCNEYLFHSLRDLIGYKWSYDHGQKANRGCATNELVTKCVKVSDSVVVLYKREMLEDCETLWIMQGGNLITFIEFIDFFALLVAFNYSLHFDCLKIRNKNCRLICLWYCF